MSIRLVRYSRDECGCETFKQVQRGIEVGGLVLVECAKHEAETQEIHTRAMEDYRRGKEVQAPAAAGVSGGADPQAAS